MADELPRTDEELNQIAVDIHHDRIWTDRHCSSPDDIRLSFMCLFFCGKDDIPEDVGMIYEHRVKAGPLRINGMPTFLSHCYLTKEETSRVWDRVGKLRRAEAEVLATAGKELYV